MPHKPKHPCGYPGCPTLTHNRYCVTHATLRAKQYERYERDKETWKRYGKEWRTLSKQYLTEHPLCVECEKRGRLTPSHEVHHIIPVKRGGTHEPKNLMALCRACHSAITIRSGV